MKPLSKKQKTIQIQRAIKKHLKNVIEPKMFNEVQELINVENLQTEFLEADNDEIKNFVIGIYLNHKN